MKRTGGSILPTTTRMYIPDIHGIQFIEDMIVLVGIHQDWLRCTGIDTTMMSLDPTLRMLLYLLLQTIRGIALPGELKVRLMLDLFSSKPVPSFILEDELNIFRFSLSPQDLRRGS
jgi:hypothetical protein